MTQERYDAILSEYYACKRLAYDDTARESVRKYYLGRMMGIAFALEVAEIRVGEAK